MTQISDAQLRKVARGLAISRDVFAQAYDDVALSQIPAATRFQALAKVVDLEQALPEGADRDAFHYLRAMQRARDGGWLVEFVFEKFPELAGPDPDAPAGAPTTDAQVARAELQSIAHRQQRFQDGRRITARGLSALRRCCIIRVSRQTAAGDEPVDEAIGSGFLIGPHLVLTNHHVIEPLVDGDGQPLDSGARVYVRFDYHAGASPFLQPRDYNLIGGDRSWLLTHAPRVPDAQPETAQTLADNLDYAVLVLDGRPGDMRGFYRLDRLSALPALLTTVQLWQFPNGATTRMTSGNFVSPPAAMGFGDETGEHPRLYHTANSLSGASGGLVLSDSGEPMGLHDAGFDDDADQDARKNRCVPLHHVARHAASFVTQEIANLPPKTGWHPRRSEPILGRLALQEHAFDAAYGRGRIIAVMTTGDTRMPKLGRTYSRTVLEACLPPDKHHFITIETSLIDPNPFKTARRIATSIDASFAGRIPTETGETTLDADATVLLVERTLGILRDAAPGKTTWLIIDDIDTDPIGTQWGSSSFLIALYRGIAESEDLRVVLAGLPRRLEGLRDLYEETGVVLEEHLFAPPDQTELKDWIEGHLTHGLHPDDFAPGLAAMMQAVAERDAVLGEAQAPTAPTPADQDDPFDEMCPTKALNRLLATYARRAFLQRGGT